MSTPPLLICDPPQPGDWNMACDEFLLEHAIATQQPAVRIYEWSVPTLSLGHFQPWSRDALPEPLSFLPAVRRLSGGGAILHDQEITYSLHIPSQHPLAQQPSRLYDLTHDAIIRVLERWGVALTPRGIPQPDKDDAFLCYSRGDQRDLMLGDHKIVGSAQRRRKGAILQHGSLLLAQSRFGNYPGLRELSSVDCEKRDNMKQELLIELKSLVSIVDDPCTSNVVVTTSDATWPIQIDALKPKYVLR